MWKSVPRLFVNSFEVCASGASMNPRSSSPSVPAMSLDQLPSRGTMEASDKHRKGCRRVAWRLTVHWVECSAESVDDRTQSWRGRYVRIRCEHHRIGPYRRDGCCAGRLREADEANKRLHEKNPCQKEVLSALRLCEFNYETDRHSSGRVIRTHEDWTQAQVLR